MGRGEGVWGGRCGIGVNENVRDGLREGGG